MLEEKERITFEFRAAQGSTLGLDMWKEAYNGRMRYNIPVETTNWLNIIKSPM